MSSTDLTKLEHTPGFWRWYFGIRTYKRIGTVVQGKFLQHIGFSLAQVFYREYAGALTHFEPHF